MKVSWTRDLGRGCLMRALVSLLCFCWLTFNLYSSATGPSSDYFEPRILTGSIYDKEGGQLLFTFRRTATREGDAVRVLREFRYPDGSMAAQERLVYERGRL